MLLAESEAKFKYCPLLTTNDDKFRFCQGAQCVMWRFAEKGKEGESDKGYCGLAGKPLGLVAKG